MPKHYLEKLVKNLSILLFNKNGTKKNNSDIGNDEIRYQFYYFFVSMLQYYKSSLNNDKNNLKDLYSKVENDTVDLYDLFKFQDFLLKVDDSIDFYNFFVRTKIWKNFIVKNLYPSTIYEKLEVLLFDEHIRQKKK